MLTSSLSLIEKQKLATCDERFCKIVAKIIEHWNITIIFGHRNKQDQDKAFAEGKTKLKWPNSKHNTTPSKAIDMCPAEVKDTQKMIDWNDRDRMHMFAGYVLAIARQLDINLRWGGDWDRDTETKDNSFDDLVHFELVD